jgi:hypothetical protein
MPAVRAFGTPYFLLAEELTRLHMVVRAEAPEAVILYGARILDVLACEAVRRLRQEPSPNAFANLQMLERLGRFGTATSYWAHSLRRLGNRVRHVQGRVSLEEADLGMLFTESWLLWFFCSFSHGDRLPALTSDGRPLLDAGREELFAAMRWLEDLEASGRSLPAEWLARPAENGAFFRTSTLAAVLTEMLLGREHAATLGVLKEGLQRFPDDLRLRQLEGLYWSRQGELDKAVALRLLLAAQFPQDEEMVGITAGVYKRLWLKQRSNTAALQRSHDGYRAGWKQSGKKNPYLGINAATTALLLGRQEESQRLAAEVEALLQRWKDSWREHLNEPGFLLGFWDQVSLAEPQLLGGTVEAADQCYQDVFARPAARVGDIAVAQRQREEIRKALGLVEPSPELPSG